MRLQENIKPLDNGTLDNLIEGYQLIGYDWRYLYVNDAVVKQSKFKGKKDLLGFTMMEKYPGIENSELFKKMSFCMSTRTSIAFDNEFTFPDGSKDWFELRIEPVPRGIFILSIDITDRKKAELSRKEYTQSLEDMIYMTSHRVRQPICNIMGLVDSLENNSITEEEHQKSREYLKSSIAALEELTKELTSYIHEQKIKAGQ